jgi:hypothetical protein
MKYFLALLIILGLLSVTQALASPQAFSLPQWTVDGGGGTSSSTNYSLRGSIGQPDAGILNGGGYILGGGFWPLGVRESEWNNIYLPLVRR